MTLKIDEKEIVVFDCGDCENSCLCALNLSQVITLLARMGVDEYKLFILKCKNFKKKEGDDFIQ